MIKVKSILKKCTGITAEGTKSAVALYHGIFNFVLDASSVPYLHLQ